MPLGGPVEKGSIDRRCPVRKNPASPGCPLASSPRPTRAATVLVVAGLGVAACGGLCGLFALGGFLAVGTKEERPPAAEEWEAMVRAGDLLALVGETADPAREVASRAQHFDGSVEINWTYEDGDRPLYVQGSINLEGSTGDASMVYQGARIGASIGGAGEMDFVDRSDLFRWGDASEFQLLQTPDGTPIGNQFLARKGKHVYWVIYSGVYTEEADVAADLLLPRLEAMERLRR